MAERTGYAANKYDVYRPKKFGAFKSPFIDLEAEIADKGQAI